MKLLDLLNDLQKVIDVNPEAKDYEVFYNEDKMNGSLDNLGFSTVSFMEKSKQVWLW